MERQRAKVAEELGEQAIVVSSPSIFTAAVYERLRVFDMPREEREVTLRNFWDNVIEADVLDSIYFAPGYERSPGSLAEHQAAERHGVPIHYLIDKLKTQKNNRRKKENA